LAHRAAERARSGETVYINDLQSNERKIVHTIISKEEGVSSHSEGNEYNRYITVTKEI
jgi:spoIIIJ-associated protein